MSNNTLVALLGVLYVASVVAGGMLSMHTVRSWHAAFWRNRTMSRFANWHPVAAVQHFAAGMPTRAPTDDDMRALFGFTIIPVVNTLIAFYVVLACPVMAAIQQLSGEGEHSAST